jgi:hypothetical protein
MADSKEDIASQALSRLGEGAISSFDEDTDTAEKVRQLYEPTILGLLGRYNWRWAKTRAVLLIDGSVSPANEWARGFLMPTARIERVGPPLAVFNSTALRAPEVFEFELEGRHILTNYDTIVIEYTARKAEIDWPGYFEELAAEALAAKLALPVTENASKEEFHTVKAFGTGSERMEGGMFGAAMRADARAMPTPGLLDASDPITEARFGGSRGNSGQW